ncbi:MAG: CvpA family protein [Rhodospirillales bacterium]|nr:CvpA family protein [Rhodospirillales bacterium]
MMMVDFIVIGVVVLAGMIATGLGLVRVVLGLGGWIGAGLATLYGFKYVRPIAHRWIDSDPLADAAAGGTLFIGSLIVLTLITHWIAHRVKNSGFGALDRTLGLVTGLALGAVIVCGSFIIAERVLQWPQDPAGRPGWIRDAQSIRVIEAGSGLLLKIVPPEWGGGKPQSNNRLDDPARAAERLMTPETKGAASVEKSGYDARERKEMDRLFQSRD